jgi:hypothetical protein
MLRFSVFPGLVLGASLLFISAHSVQAQVSVEVRAGASVGNHVPAYSGFDGAPGLSLAGTVEFRSTALLSPYGTVLRAEFGCDEGFCTNREIRMRAQGFGAGVRLHPKRLPWLRAGVLHYGTTVESDDGSTSAAASLGYEVGAGFSIPLRRRVRLLPGAYVRTQSGEERTTMAGAEVGLQISF